LARARASGLAQAREASRLGRHQHRPMHHRHRTPPAPRPMHTAIRRLAIDTKPYPLRQPRRLVLDVRRVMASAGAPPAETSSRDRTQECNSTSGGRPVADGRLQLPRRTYEDSTAGIAARSGGRLKSALRAHRDAPGSAMGWPSIRKHRTGRPRPDHLAARGRGPCDPPTYRAVCKEDPRRRRPRVLDW